MILSLDHLTISDSTPLQLIDAANDAGYRGVCMFLESMLVINSMPEFSAIREIGMRRELRNALTYSGITLELAYPFTLTGKTRVSDLERALECAADLGAKAVNVLIYDRDPSRRLDSFSEFCAAAKTFNVLPALEFYPLSQVRSLPEATNLVGKLEHPGAAGVNVDILHLMRSGGKIEDLRPIKDSIVFGQLSDGMSYRAADELELEASSDRLLPGAGTFPLAAFAAALPPNCPISVEAPSGALIGSGVSHKDRARQAMDAARRACASS